MPTPCRYRKTNEVHRPQAKGRPGSLAPVETNLHPNALISHTRYFKNSASPGFASD
jgi:hypothetical protein